VGAAHLRSREDRPAIFELAAQVEPKHGITIRKMSRRGCGATSRCSARSTTTPGSATGLRPYSQKDLDNYAQEMQLVFDRDWFMVAEHGDEAVAIAITIPDVNQVLKRMQGACCRSVVALSAQGQDHRPLPRGLPRGQAEYQHTGVPPPCTWSTSTCRPSPRSSGGDGWILENNRAMNAGWRR
jgi:hypothetical protein